MIVPHQMQVLAATKMSCATIITHTQQATQWTMKILTTKSSGSSTELNNNNSKTRWKLPSRRELTQPTPHSHMMKSLLKENQSARNYRLPTLMIIHSLQIPLSIQISIPQMRTVPQIMKNPFSVNAKTQQLMICRLPLLQLRDKELVIIITILIIREERENPLILLSQKTKVYNNYYITKNIHFLIL